MNTKKLTSNSKTGTLAFAAALLTLAVAGTLTYILWQHWAYLMPA